MRLQGERSGRSGGVSSRRRHNNNDNNYDYGNIGNNGEYGDNGGGGRRGSVNCNGNFGSVDLRARIVGKESIPIPADSRGSAAPSPAGDALVRDGADSGDADKNKDSGGVGVNGGVGGVLCGREEE